MKKKKSSSLRKRKHKTSLPMPDRRLIKVRRNMNVESLFKKGHKKECVCCGATKGLTFDHIKPISKGGEDLTSNGQILCGRCNNLKRSTIISIEDLRIKIGIK